MTETILGLDIGDRRVGLAISRTSSLATPLAVLERTAKNAEKIILEIILEENVQLLVVGLPLSVDGSENLQCQKIRTFCDRLLRRSSARIIYIDEYASSAEAEDLLSLVGHRGKKRAAKSDAAAACLILQSYLDAYLDGQRGS